MWPFGQEKGGAGDVAFDGYRSGTRTTYVARDDLAPVVLEEVFEAPPW